MDPLTKFEREVERLRPQIISARHLLDNFELMDQFTQDVAVFDRETLFLIQRLRKYDEFELLVLDYKWRDLTYHTMSIPFMEKGKEWRRDTVPYRFVKECNRLWRRALEEGKKLFWLDIYHWCERILALQLAYVIDWVISSRPTKIASAPFVQINQGPYKSQKIYAHWSSYYTFVAVAKGGGVGMDERRIRELHNIEFIYMNDVFGSDRKFDDVETELATRREIHRDPLFAFDRLKDKRMELIFTDIYDQRNPRSWKLFGRLLPPTMELAKSLSRDAIEQPGTKFIGTIVCYRDERSDVPVLATNLTMHVRTAANYLNPTMPVDTIELEYRYSLVALDPFALGHVLAVNGVKEYPILTLDRAKHRVERTEFQYRPGHGHLEVDQKLLDFARACESIRFNDASMSDDDRLQREQLLEMLADELYPLLLSNRRLIRSDQGFLAYKVLIPAD